VSVIYTLRAVYYAKSVIEHKIIVTTAAVNVTLLAFAAGRRAAVLRAVAAPLLLGTRRCRSISSARRALSSKPAARCCSGR